MAHNKIMFKVGREMRASGKKPLGYGSPLRLESDKLGARGRKEELAPFFLGCQNSWEVDEVQGWVHQGPLCCRPILLSIPESSVLAGHVQTSLSNAFKRLCAL